MPSAADYQWPASKKVSPDCKDIVAKILVVDFKERITIAQIQVSPHHIACDLSFSAHRNEDAVPNTSEPMLPGAGKRPCPCPPKPAITLAWQLTQYDKSLFRGPNRLTSLLT